MTTGITWTEAGYPRGPNGEKLDTEDFVKALLGRQAEEAAAEPLCTCGWDGEGTGHCVICHETETEPLDASKPSHFHVLQEDGTYIRDRSQEE